MIEVDDLWRVYQVGDQTIEAVRGIGLTVAEGEFVSIVGHSGSGKSTLLSMVGGLARPSRGTVRIGGVDLWSRGDAFRSEVRNGMIGFIFQFASLIPTLSTVENIALPHLFRADGSHKAVHEEARELLVRVGLGAKLDSFPNELSGGQQRRVAIARALINRPRVILADEPTGDLDERTEAEVMALLLAATREHKAAFLMVTHNMSIARAADRMLQMKDGILA
ncbi:MAG: ABC transporter ATP-binding protein [Burkholderiaceae bacterium]|nr:ABC transporter ATP-binding protein [Burkholderiaceae bacterium]